MGADGYFALVNQAVHLGQLYGLHPYRIKHLLGRYGSLIDEVLAPAKQSPELLQPITDAPDYLQAEAVYAVAAEGALHLEDILARRTRISIEYTHRGVNCAEQVARLVAPILGWTTPRSTARSKRTAPASRPRCSRRRSPTTSPPTPCVPRPPRPARKFSNRYRHRP